MGSIGEFWDGLGQAQQVIDPVNDNLVFKATVIDRVDDLSLGHGLGLGGL